MGVGLIDERKKVAIIQARMRSTRLPGKVLKPILGRPMLQLLVERVQKSTMLDQILVATSDRPEDDRIADLVAGLPQVSLFRGSEQDVLERYFQAAKSCRADVILRITADNPFFDWETADRILQELISGGFDYVSNNLRRTFPYGIDLEAFTFKALAEAHVQTSNPRDREHVTPYIRENHQSFKLGEITWNEDLSRLRLTVDTPEDYQKAVILFERFGENVTFRDVAGAFPV